MNSEDRHKVARARHLYLTSLINRIRDLENFVETVRDMNGIRHKIALPKYITDEAERLVGKGT